MPRFLALLGLLVIAAGCGSSLALTHSETACVMPGGSVTLQTRTQPGTVLSYRVQDDFGGDVGTINPITVDASGTANAHWAAPGQLSTTTLHFILTAANGDRRANRDIHVIVGGNGRSC